MAGSFVAASSQYLSNASAVVSAVPLTMACWFNSDSATAKQTLIAIVDTAATSDWFTLRASGDVAGDPVQAVARRSTDATATTSSGYTAGTWHHAAGVFTSDANRDAYIDGGNSGNNTTSRAPTGLDETRIGRNVSGGVAYHMSGLIAEAALWNVALTAAEIASLAKGVSPLAIRPGNLVLYSPLVRTLTNDIVGGLTLTNNGGATVAAHPRIYMPRGPKARRFTTAAVGGGTSPKLIGGKLTSGGILIGGRLVA